MPLTEKEILNSTKMPVLASSWLSVRLLVQKVRLSFQLRFAVVVSQRKNLTKYTIMVLMISAELQASTLESSKNLVSWTSLYSMHQSMEMFTEFQMVLFSLRVLYQLIHQDAWQTRGSTEANGNIEPIAQFGSSLGCLSSESHILIQWCVPELWVGISRNWNPGTYSGKNNISHAGIEAALVMIGC